MTKQEYLNELRRNLRGFSQEEIDDILYDYEEHFSIGLSSGKTEEEIAEDLGDPKDIAEQYKKAKGNPTIEETARYYKEKAKEKTRAFSKSISESSNKTDKLMKIVLFIVLAIILSPIILGIAGSIIGIFIGGISLIFSCLIGMISCIALAATSTGGLTSLFFGVIWILISLIFLGILMTTLGYYGIKACIVLIKKAIEYLTEPKLKDKKPFWNKKAVVGMIVSLVIFIATFSVGLFQTISSGLSIGKDLAPQISNYLGEFDYGQFNFDLFGTSHTINDSESRSIESVNKITIKSSIADVNILKSDTDELKTELKGKYNSNDNNTLKLSVTENNDNLIIETQNSPHNIFSRDLTLNIYIPESYKGDISITNVSGDIKSERVLELNSLRMETVSGDIEFNSVSAPTVTANTTSGDIEFNKLNTNTSSLKTVSGDIKASSYVGTLTVDSTSGSIDINLAEVKGASTINSVSGDVELGVEVSNNLALEGKTTSGSIEVADGVNTSNIEKGDKLLKATFNSGDNKLNITTASGDIKLDNF
ncbi:DUF4097 family beta strand repeat-containing protein [Clostridium sp. LIBA-8841]|uniref:DUF4097 family beta strand repeat-containing protein n=1 Tax=Clostridium sp. LIBA-8841 TaxID=2987530 RepID=UPI002AC702A6|nr:DUF4097 family beta strand repeat-containing protein [Clostridium sp. LIBA-8841]MDZ5255118.1 DUF4097 family beta strand repeat-containing protein [Clostridium sp. LIBA-8841]